MGERERVREGGGRGVVVKETWFYVFYLKPLFSGKREIVGI